MTPRIIPVGEEPPPMNPSPRTPSSDGRQRHQGRDRDKPKKKAGERFQTLNTFIDFSLADLTRTEIAAWMILYRDSKEGTARTAMTDIARRAGCSVRQVVRAVQRLEALGLVRVVHRGGFRRGASRYRVQSLTREV